MSVSTPVSNQKQRRMVGISAIRRGKREVEIASVTGAVKRTVKNWKRRNGIAERKKGSGKKSDVLKHKKSLLQIVKSNRNASVIQITTKLNKKCNTTYSRRTVDNWLRKLNITKKQLLISLL